MKPEDFRTDNKRPLTGEEYLKACRTGGNLYLRRTR